MTRSGRPVANRRPAGRRKPETFLLSPFWEARDESCSLRCGPETCDLGTRQDQVPGRDRFQVSGLKFQPSSLASVARLTHL